MGRCHANYVHSVMLLYTSSNRPQPQFAREDAKTKPISTVPCLKPTPASDSAIDGVIHNLHRTLSDEVQYEA